jgi:hypothetical protein
MDNRIVAVFCHCDDILKVLYYQEDQLFGVGDAEIMTIVLTAALHFGGN